jgi:hypothetical protein
VLSRSPSLLVENKLVNDGHRVYLPGREYANRADGLSLVSRPTRDQKFLQVLMTFFVVFIDADL